MPLPVPVQKALALVRGAMGRVLADPTVLVFVLSLMAKSELLIFLVADTSTSLYLADARNWGGRHETFWACALLTAVPALLFKGRGRLRYLLFFEVFFSLLFFADAMHFRTFGSAVTVYSVLAVRDLLPVLKSLLLLLRPVDAAFLAGPVLMGVLAWALRRRRPTLRRQPALAALVLAGSLGWLGWQHYALDVRQGAGHRSFWKRTFHPVQTLARLSPVAFHVFDVANYVQEQRTTELSPEQRAAIERWFDEKAEPPPPVPQPYRGVLKGKNLLVLQVESLETFPIGHKVGGQEITPNLNALLPNALFFSDLHEQINGGGSCDSDFLVNTSLFPVRVGTVFHRFPDNHYPAALPRLLKERGYSTLAAHPDRGTIWNCGQGVKKLGFDRYLDLTDFTVDEYIYLGLSDESFLRQVRPHVCALKAPFYAFLVTLTSHHPFEIDASKHLLKLPDHMTNLAMGRYLQCLRYTDEHLGRFLRALDEDGLLDDTVVAVVGDHSGIHRFYPNEVLLHPQREEWWPAPSDHIPLLVWAKGLEGKEIKLKGGQVDIMPTLLHLLGVEDEAWFRATIGRSLLSTRESFAVTIGGNFQGPTTSRLPHALQAVEVADWIVTGQYFEKHRPAQPAKAAPAAAP